MIIIREKSYAENEEKKGMSTGTKVALGTAGTLAAGVGTFAAARRGALGRAAKLRSNVFYGNLGRKFGSKKMMNSAADKLSDTISRGPDNVSDPVLKKWYKNKYLNTWKRGENVKLGLG